MVKLSELFNTEAEDIRDKQDEWVRGDLMAIYQNGVWSIGLFDSLDKGSIYLQGENGRPRHVGRWKRARVMRIQGATQ